MLSIKQERKVQYSLTTWSPEVFQLQAFLEPQGQYVCDSKPSPTSMFVPLKPKVGTFCSIPLKSIENQSNRTDLSGKEKDAQIIFLGFTTLCRTRVGLGFYWRFNSPSRESLGPYLASLGKDNTLPSLCIGNWLIHPKALWGSSSRFIEFPVNTIRDSYHIDKQKIDLHAVMPADRNLAQ